MENVPSYTKLRQLLNEEGSLHDSLNSFVQTWVPSIRFVNHHSDLAQGLQKEAQDDHSLQQRREMDSSQVPRRNRLPWFNGHNGRQLRLSKDLPHDRISLPSQKRCVVCRTMITAVCKFFTVPLCVQRKMRRQKTCWDRFHSNKRLESDTPPSRLPPDSENDGDVPNSRKGRIGFKRRLSSQ